MLDIKKIQEKTKAAQDKEAAFVLEKTNKRIYMLEQQIERAAEGGNNAIFVQDEHRLNLDTVSKHFAELGFKTEILDSDDLHISW